LERWAKNPHVSNAQTVVANAQNSDKPILSFWENLKLF
jgi:hypothetical protein